MKKILFGIIMLSLLASMAFAQEIKPYGSARIGYWYEMLSEVKNNDVVTRESDLDLNYGLQGNSRFGVNFKKDDLTAKVEYGYKDGIDDLEKETKTSFASLRLLYAKMNMGSYSILIGQDYDGLSEYAGQVYGDDTNLIGWGAVDGKRNPQVKVEYQNGFYFAFVKPTMTAPDGLTEDVKSKDLLFPRVNVGMKFKMDNFYIHPTLAVQQFSYSKDDNPISDDISVMSYQFAVTGQMNMDALMLRAQLNYGGNAGNMDYKFAEQAHWNNDKKELTDASTLGGFFEFGYKVSDMMTLDAGLGYMSNDRDTDDYEQADSRMALYGQIKLKFGALQVIPEMGMMNEMENEAKVKEGSKMYFGTQLRMDF